MSRELHVAYSMILGGLRSSIKKGTDRVEVKLLRTEALATLLCMENAGVAVEGCTQRAVEEATTGPRWVPDWARKIL